MSKIKIIMSEEQAKGLHQILCFFSGYKSSFHEELINKLWNNCPLNEQDYGLRQISDKDLKIERTEDV